MQHCEESILLPADTKEVFDFLDDHNNLSSHMNKSSWMMGGGKMETIIDNKHGKEIGSHIQMSGKVFGISLYLDEVVIKRQPPTLKIWETVGTPKLLVVGPYQMKFEIKQQDDKSNLIVSIDYQLPKTNTWLGKLFGGIYAKWCVKQMISGAKSHFNQ